MSECKNSGEEVIADRLLVEEHIVGLEVVVNFRVKMSIFGPLEVLCVFIGWLECEECCPGVCPSVSPLPLSQWRFERGKPVWSTWLRCLGKEGESGEVARPPEENTCEVTDIIIHIITP